MLCGRVVTYATSYPAISAVIVVVAIAGAIFYKFYRVNGYSKPKTEVSNATSSSPPEPTHVKVQNKVSLLDNPNFKIEGLRFVSQNNLNSPLRAQANSLSEEDLLKSLIPGNYSVTIKGESVAIDDPNIQNAFKNWLGISPENEITLDDIKKLQTYIRFQDLGQDQMKDIRQSMYASLYPLLKEEPINLSFMTGFNGEEITLRQENSQLVMSSCNFNKEGFSLSISKDGDICYKFYADKSHYFLSVNLETSEIQYQEEPPEHLKTAPVNTWHQENSLGKYQVSCINEQVCYFSMNNENETTIETFHGAEYEDRDLNIPQSCESSISPKKSKCAHKGQEKLIVQTAVNQSRSYVEFLHFKLDQIIGFLNNDNNQAQLRTAFQGCQSILNSFEQSINQLTEKDPLAISKNEVEKTSYSLGNMWNPVVASEDSSFTWRVINEQKTQKTSISLQKESDGRGKCGGTASRTIMLSKTKDPNILKVKISKSDRNDTDSYTSSSKYSIEDRGNQGFLITPIGIKNESMCTPLFFGMDYFSKNSENIQTSQQMQDDIKFILRAFFTISDIQSSPDTIILDKKSSLIRNFQGNPVPAERLKHISMKYSQGGHSTSVVHLNSSNELEW